MKVIRKVQDLLGRRHFRTLHVATLDLKDLLSRVAQKESRLLDVDLRAAHKARTTTRQGR